MHLNGVEFSTAGQLIDISEGGFALETNYAFQIGETVFARMEYTDRATDAIFEIVWKNENTSMYGARFKAVDPRSVTSI